MYLDQFDTIFQSQPSLRSSFILLLKNESNALLESLLDINLTHTESLSVIHRLINVTRILDLPEIELEISRLSRGRGDSLEKKVLKFRDQFDQKIQLVEQKFEQIKKS